ncbi:hypothetical protein Tco_0445670 [Tanacetum coccineum]
MPGDIIQGNGEKKSMLTAPKGTRFPTPTRGIQEPQRTQSVMSVVRQDIEEATVLSSLPDLLRYIKKTNGLFFPYIPTIENKIFVARNAEFLENSLINHEASGSLEDLEIIQEEDTHPSLDTSLNHEEDDLRNG